MIVAIIDLADKRLMPQIPWPLVQPLPIFVPLPTKTPAVIIPGSEAVIHKGMSILVKNKDKIGPTPNPTINKKKSELFCFKTWPLL